jgi:hypothetical protein
MNRHHFDGYQDGYLHKIATPPGAGTAAGAAIGVGKATAGAATDTAAALLPYVLLIPAIMGVGAGAAHSKLTSPSQTDMKTVPKALETSEMEEFATELNRQRENAMQEEVAMDDQKENGSARTLRI